MKKYIKVKGQEFKIEVSYDLGGYSYLSHRKVTRGYYLSIKPVERVELSDGGGYSETYRAYSGTKMLLLEVKRKSKKQYQKAVLLAEEKEKELLDFVIKDNEHLFSSKEA